MTPLPATLFSDFTCPYSYVTEVGLRRLGGRVEVRYRALERFPAPDPPPPPDADAGWEDRVRPVAEELSIRLAPPPFRPRTRKAHEAARFAQLVGAGEAMRDALFAAYWADGRDIGRIDVIQGLAADLGLDPTDLKIALDIDRFRDDVLGDAELARRLRVPGVPTLFLGTGAEARVLVGAQGPRALDEAVASL